MKEENILFIFKLNTSLNMNEKYICIYISRLPLKIAIDAITDPWLPLFLLLQIRRWSGH